MVRTPLEPNALLRPQAVDLHAHSKVTTYTRDENIISPHTHSLCVISFSLETPRGGDRAERGCSLLGGAREARGTPSAECRYRMAKLGEPETARAGRPFALRFFIVCLKRKKHTTRRELSASDCLKTFRAFCLFPDSRAVLIPRCSVFPTGRPTTSAPHIVACCGRSRAAYCWICRMASFCVR